jgi:hypothetical protein
MYFNLKHFLLKPCHLNTIESFRKVIQSIETKRGDLIHKKVEAEERS